MKGFRQSSTSRRRFLQNATALSGGLLTSLSAQESKSIAGANQRLRVGVVGLGRGMAHIAGFQKVPHVEIAAVSDVDQRRLDQGVERAAKGQLTKPKAVDDFRRILDDPEIDVLSIAMPNFWHAPATILACAAGKHVYVEKPGSHNPYESGLMVEAAAKYQRQVQMGNQRRSLPAMKEGIEQIRAGAIGQPRYARCWYVNQRGSIGHGKRTPVPDWLNYDLWQGPSPERPYQDNLVHYNWHWMWHWGNGELGNNGVHALDIARWALNADYPTRVTCQGSRYYHDDDQETPDTAYASFDFGKTGANWEGSSCHRRKPEKPAFASIYGSNGMLSFESNGYRVYDPEGKVVQENLPSFTDVPHFTNLANAIRDGEPLNAPIADAQKSTMLCHLGNIAYRTGSTLRTNPVTGEIIDHPQAAAYWKRNYRKGWEPTI